MHDRTMDALSEQELFALALLLNGYFSAKEDAVSSRHQFVIPEEGLEFGTISYN